MKARLLVTFIGLPLLILMLLFLPIGIIVPFVLLFLGYAIGSALGWAESGCVLIGFGFFALGVAFNVIYQRKKKASPITFEIIKIRES